MVECKKLLTLLSLTILPQLAACQYWQGMDQQNSGVTYDGGTLMLSDVDLRSMKEAGAAGDGMSAYLVYQHYAFGMGNPDEGLPWLEKSASANYPYAIKALATLEYKRRDEDSRE